MTKRKEPNGGAAKEQESIPQGRWGRLGRLAGLTTKLGAGIAGRALKRSFQTGNEDGHAGLGLTRAHAEKIVNTLGEMKGLAMKMGQMLSMEADYLPDDVRAVIGRLCSQAPPMTPGTVAGVLLAELGKPPHELFAEFEDHAFAAASLGQVHRATLKDGRRVAVKIQYPGIDKAVLGDLRSAETVVRGVGLFGGPLDASEFYKEFAEELTGELDYYREARRIKQARLDYAQWPELAVPEVVESLSTLRVLTMSYLEGQTLVEFLQLEHDPRQRRRVSEQLLTAVLGPFFACSRIHADPHPGNFLILEDGRLGLLDFGNFLEIPDQLVAGWQKLFLDGRQMSPGEMVDVLIKMGFSIETPRAQAEEITGRFAAAMVAPLIHDEYDFGQSTIIKDFRKVGFDYMLPLVKYRPPPPAIHFFRTSLGLLQNLKALGGKGNFRAIIRSLADGPHLPVERRPENISKRLAVSR